MRHRESLWAYCWRAVSELHPAVVADLERLGIPHEVLDCDPAMADTASFCAHYGFDPADSANTILVASRRPEGRYAACVVLSTTRLDVNHKVRHLLGANKASFASAELTGEVTGMEIGGVTPFGLPSDLAIFVDQAVMSRRSVILGGGNRSSKLRIDPADMASLAAVSLISGLAAPPDG